MGRGRPRKSVEDHVRDGTYRRDRHGPLPGEKPALTLVPASPPLPPPKKPKAVPQEQSELWDQLTRLLDGVVTDRDVPMLTDLCWWWAELRRVQNDLRSVSPGEKGYKDMITCAGICSTNLDKVAVKFGLTPVDRSRMKVETGPPVAKVPTKPKTKLDQRGAPNEVMRPRGKDAT